MSSGLVSIDTAAAFAALILADASIPITAESILALASAASVELEPIWAQLLAKALKGKDVNALLVDLSTSTAPNAPNGQGKNQNVENAQEEEPDVDPANENADDIEDGDDSLFGLFD